jgi:TolB-like protein/Tfp pilus assembly protein PilF
MPGDSKAVFLSYASEDSEAAQRIADALRAAGIEVWFDKSELRGGDAWDRQIRQQIHECRLFIPIISAHSEQRDEGYFRREWKLAVDRTHDMAEKRAFLVPVVIDGTSERGASVPDKFLDLQWTRMPQGVATLAFVEQVGRMLATAPANSPASSAATARPAPQLPQILVRRRLKPVYALAFVVLLALAYLALALHKRHEAPVANAASIAVLPLANESGDPDQQFFSDGLSESLITALSQFPGLKVIGRTSAFQFRDSKEDARSIGAKLNVGRLLEGSVQRSGDMIRVRAELIDTEDGRTHWSERYDRPYRDLFALQDDITQAVVQALQTKLLPDRNASAQDERPTSGNLDAYSALLQGRFFMSRDNEGDIRRAIEQFTKATSIDPKYALAWCELSFAWSGLGTQLDSASAKQAYAKSREAVDRALALAPKLSDAHVARGYLLQRSDFDWPGAEAEYREALALAPESGESQFYLAQQIAFKGQLKQAIGLTRRALTTDPLQSNWLKWLSTYLLGANQVDSAEQAIRKAIQLQPAGTNYYQMLALIEIQRGNASSALDAAMREPDGPVRDSAIAMALQIGHDSGAADAALKALINKRDDSTSYSIAQAYALRNDPDAMFQWLDRAWIARNSDFLYVLFDPIVLRFKDDPRFGLLCRKVGLPAPAGITARRPQAPQAVPASTSST